ncbi:MAG: calcium/sodium antiporter [Bacteroidales bacterium]|nr:calcium/sodium antiporter [Bacteroidales bacterium]HOY38142.1 calcium/sodium antiporter [Bacteroidales bacterium]HQP03040.1 calcium/sodium antiporter [Bacteroidales bacterium]
MNVLLVILGLLMLVVGSELLVRGGVSIAKRVKISPLIIGLTIVSMGTSTPELVVSVKAALQGYPDMAMGNVLGSNIVNISFILGLTAVILAIPVNRETAVFSWPVLLLATVLLFGFSCDFKLARWEGIVFVALQVLFIVALYFRSKRKKQQDEEDSGKTYSIVVSILMLIASIAGLSFGAEFLVKGAVGLATHMGVDERIISLTIVAIGTSMPELITSVVAAMRKQMDISIGNLIGSNIFNIFTILGVSSAITPITVNPQSLYVDMTWAFGLVILLGLCFIPLRNSVVKRWKGLLLVVAYMAYFFYIF